MMHNKGENKVPYRITQLPTKTHVGNLRDIKYNYAYPRGLDLHPGHDLHDKLRDEIMVRAHMSHDAMSSRYDSWNKIDEKLTAYIDLTEEEVNLKAQDPNKPISIVVPVSSAALEVLLGYMVAAFLEEPVFRYEGTGGEDVLGAMLLERVVGVQTRKAKLGLQLHTMFRDAFAYGLGAVAPVWTKELGFKMVREGNTVVRKEGVKFEGNMYYNIDPYLYLPDPNYPIQDIQRSEFQGWVQRTNRMDILSREEADTDFFNAQYLAHIDGRSILAMDESERDKYGVSNRATSDITNPVDVLWMYAKLVPSEWKIGTRTYPEKWLLGLAGDEVVVYATPAESNHGMFPLATCSPDYDGYSTTPISKIETIYGMQTLIDFLYNSHVTNIRKAINDMFVVDPLMINVEDVANPSPGKIIRTRKRAWGQGVKDYIQQLSVVDVTGRHTSDAQSVIDLLEKTVGVGDVVAGMIRSGGERRSATEYRETKNSAMLRLERSARVAGLQAITDLAYMTAMQTQQYMTVDQYAKIAGPYEQELRDQYGPDATHLKISPFDIIVDFDIVTPDGSLPTSGDPSMWMAMMQIISSQPYLLQNFDIVKIFKQWARISGAKNVNDFVLRSDQKAKVVQDQEVAAAVEAGNMIPIKEGATNARQG